MPLLLAQMSKIFKPQLSIIIFQSVDHYVHVHIYGSRILCYIHSIVLCYTHLLAIT